MIPREITGPQAQFERSGADRFRDVRPTTVRLSQGLRSSASGLVLAAAAGATYAYPACLDLAVPLSTLYAAWVLTRRVVLPLRLPWSARCRDWTYPEPGTRKPRLAAGSIYLGRCQVTGQELWITAEDGRQHASVPGTTGAGKTTLVRSLLANALAHGSGFVLVDGKGNNQLYGEVLAEARLFGREDDVRLLNFLVASGVKQSNTFNPLATGNADAVRELLASQLGEQSGEDKNGVFRARAVALIGTMAPVLVWLRDRKGVAINIETVRFALELRSIWMLATQRLCPVRDPRTGKVSEIPVPEMPEALVYPLLAYLGELPGYDTSVAYNEQKGEEPSRQHGFALFYFTATFTQWAVSLGHIFKVESGDVDMRDVVLNRRILVVNLPSLENSEDSLAALGKIIVASLRGMLAQLLGAKVEGDPKEIFALKPGMGEAPFHVVFDELAYYATSGMDRMLAMGRGLNAMFWLGFQEVSGIWARLGEKTHSLLGNANLTLAMRQQDAERTRRWIETTAGQVEVTQATAYVGGGAGNYREAQSAEVRQVAGVDWADLQRLIEGEAIVMFAGKRIHAKLFHAPVDTSGPIRLNRPVMLAAPDRAQVQGEAERVRKLAHAIENGEVAGAEGEPASPALAALLAAFAATARAGGDARTCPAAAIAAAGQAPHSAPDRAAAGAAEGESAADEPPQTELRPMLDATAEAGPVAPSAGTATPTAAAGDAATIRSLSAIEAAAGADPQRARAAALATVAVRAAAVPPTAEAARPEMASADLRATLDRLVERLAA